jgi:hypothetical protein
MAKKSKKKGRRKISSAKVKENLEKRQFTHAYIKLPDGMDFFQAEFEKGKTTKTYKMNIVPFGAGPHNRESDEGELWWRSKYDAAKKVGPDEVQVASPRSIGKKCPIYDAWKVMADDPDIDDDDIKDLRPKSREMFYVQDTADDSGKIWLLDISYFLFGKKLDEELRSEDGEDYLAFADVEDGCTLKLRFKQNSYGKATYQEVDKIDFIKRKGVDIDDDVIDSLKDPMELITFLSVPEIKKIMEGDEEEEEDDIPMDYPKKKKTKKKSSKSNAPAKKKKKKKVEEEEEETPKKKKKKKSSKSGPPAKKKKKKKSNDEQDW